MTAEFYQLSRIQGRAFSREIASKWKPLYTCTQQRKKSPASDTKSKLFPRAYGGQFLRSIKETQSKNLRSFKKAAHLVTYIQYRFVYQWTQWLQWKIAKAFVYCTAILPIKMRVWVSCFFFVPFYPPFYPVLPTRSLGVAGGRCWQLFWALNRIGGKVLAHVADLLEPVFAGTRRV